MFELSTAAAIFCDLKYSVFGLVDDHDEQSQRRAKRGLVALLLIPVCVRACVCMYGLPQKSPPAEEASNLDL